MDDCYTLVRRRNGDYDLVEIESGRLELLHSNGKILAFKEHGRHYHSGQGRPQRYSPAKYRVFEVECDVEAGRTRVRQLTAWLCRATVGVDDPYRP
jgi:hypothetical protein